MENETEIRNESQYEQTEKETFIILIFFFVQNKDRKRKEKLIELESLQYNKTKISKKKHIKKRKRWMMMKKASQKGIRA